MPDPSRIDKATALRLLGILVVVMLLWRTPLVAPLKIFVVLLHELSHGAAALLTGGAIERIELSADQGGVCYTRGGSRLLILSAGYLGSMLSGGTLMLLAARTRLDRAFSAAIGVGLGLIALVYVRSLFGFAFTLTASLALIALSLRFGHDANEFVLKSIGMTSILYAPLDVFDDVIARSGLGSDAEKLAELTLIPSWVWGALWIALSVMAAAGFTLAALRRDPAHHGVGA